MTESCYLIEHRLSDGTWTQVSVPIESGLADARLILAQAGAQHPDEEPPPESEPVMDLATFFRLVLITTTTDVVDV